MTPDLVAADERRKYSKMWALPTYRTTSPGLNIAPRAAELLGLRPGATLIDYGCGEGKAVDWFRSQGVLATGIDLVPLREDVVEACLWSLETLPDTLTADFAFSADVLEHIPPARVMDVLQGIRDRTRVAGAFTIATVPDGHGPRVGEVLHLTVEPAEWWEARLRELWPIVEHYPGSPAWRHLFVVRR